jgi:hypothetical protein
MSITSMLSVVWRLPVSFRFKTSYRESQSMSPGALHGIFRKSQWGLPFAADVQRLRGVVAGKVASINLLFGFAQRVGLSDRDNV